MYWNITQTIENIDANAHAISNGRFVLLAQSEALHQRAVLLDVFLTHVVQQIAATAHQLQQAAATGKILRVRLEMLGEIVNARGE